MKILTVSLLSVALSASVIAQSGGAGGGSGSAGGSAAGAGSAGAGDTTGTAADGTGTRAPAGTPGVGITGTGVSATGVPGETLGGQGIPATGIPNPTGVGNGVGAVGTPELGNRPASGATPTARPGQIGGVVGTAQQQPVLAPNTLPGNLPATANPTANLPQATSQIPGGGVNRDFPGRVPLPGSQIGVNARAGAPGVFGANGQTTLTPAQNQQLEILALQLNALRGANATAGAQAANGLDVALRQMVAGNPQLSRAGSMNGLANSLVTGWRGANMTPVQQRQALTAIANALNTTGDQASAQRALADVRHHLQAGGMQPAAAMKIQTDLQALQRQGDATGAAASGQTGGRVQFGR